MDRLGKAERDRQFTDYVTSSRAHLRRTAYLLCGDWHLAEDLVQTTLAKLYVAWPRLHRDSTPDAFARRVLVRAHIDETRRPWNRRRARQEPSEDVAREGLPVEERDELMRALADLPPGQRQAVVLRHWLGLSVEETARDLACSTGTVKSQTARAVARLREALHTASRDGEDQGDASPTEEDTYERSR
jgi:RNA polymerase sigma-70 factor (sigma-E family)